MANPHPFAHCKGVDWYTALRECGAVDCFADTPYDGKANAPGFTKPPEPKSSVEALLCSYKRRRLVSKQQLGVDATFCC